jgi:hypothetical protein
LCHAGGWCLVIAFPYQNTDQVWVWFRSIDFSRSYDPWTYKNITIKLSVFHIFYLYAFRYSFDILYIALPYQDTDQVWVWCPSIQEVLQIIQFSSLFFLSAYIYHVYIFDILYIALPYQDADVVQIWFWCIDLSRSYGLWTWKNIMQTVSSALLYSPISALQSWIVTNQNDWTIFDWIIPSVGVLVLLAIRSECILNFVFPFKFFFFFLLFSSWR